jgi:hypothetical protein
MTLSPPANVKGGVLETGEAARVLACGVDSLVLAVDVRWRDVVGMDKLRELKSAAQVDDREQTGTLMPRDGAVAWVFVVKPFGVKGYEWLLQSGELDMRIGDWLEPKSRPSVMAELRSEFLWTHGPAECVKRMVALLDALGCEVVTMKVSRADLCVDILLRESEWGRGLVDHLVTRAHGIAPHFNRRYMEGISIGRGDFSARLYDKPYEIKHKSRKIWMFDVWGIKGVPEHHRIIRVEFQARREALKELGVDSVEDLLTAAPNVWAYATRQWLKVQDNPDRHHTMQKTAAWWQVVQAGYTAAQTASPLIRAKAIAVREDQHCRSIAGYVTAQTALMRQGELIAKGETLDVGSHVTQIMHMVKRCGLTDAEFTERVKRKQAKLAWAEAKFDKASSIRRALGLSSVRSGHQSRRRSS